MSNETIKIETFHLDAVIPKQGSELAAGYDLYCVEDQVILPRERTTIPLGFGTVLPPHIHARIESRSGLALKGLVVLTGVIDSDYRGEWKVIMMNTTDYPVRFSKGDRIAQAVLRPNIFAEWEPVLELTETARGAGGFGSSGSR